MVAVAVTCSPAATVTGKLNDRVIDRSFSLAYVDSTPIVREKENVEALLLVSSPSLSHQHHRSCQGHRVSAPLCE